MITIRQMTTLVLVTVVLGSATLQAQQGDKAQSSVVRVGVPLMENNSTRSINRKQQRDWLVLGFQPEKKKKKKGEQPETVRIEAIALDGDSPADVLREAQDKNCEYILYTNLV